MKKDLSSPKYPGIKATDDGSAAVVAMETAASEAAGAYPITPSTQMGEGWAAAVAAGKRNVNGRSLIFFEPEGEHAAAGVTAGMSMVGMRSTNFSSGQGIAYMHESLYAAVGKRLTYVLNVACRAMTKHSLNVHAGHDDYHAVDDTGFFQLFAKDVQAAADLNLISHRTAELSLNPGICAQDGFLTSHVIESFQMPERELVKEYLGDPADLIDSPTPSQQLVFGEQRRRIPEMYDYDYPAMLGVVQNQESYAQGVAAQRPFYFDHIADLTDQAMREYAELTGRSYARVMGYNLEDAEYVIAGQGSLVPNAMAAAKYLRETRGLKVGVLDLVMFRPFPADLISSMLRGKKAVTVLERTDQPLAVDLPVLREIRSCMAQAYENSRAQKGELPHPGLASIQATEIPDFFSGSFGMGSRDLQPGDLIAAVENMLEDGNRKRQFYLGIDFIRKNTTLPKLQIWQEQIMEGYPEVGELAIDSAGDINIDPEGTTAVRIHSVGGWGAITMGKNLALTSAQLLGLHIKANPKYGSEKKGQPTTFYATLSHEPLLLNCEVKNVGVVLCPDPNVFHHSIDPLAGLGNGGVLVVQSDQDAQAVWETLPQVAQDTVRQKNIRIFFVNGFEIAREEASDVELKYRMQGVAFMGAFFRTAPLMEREGLSEERLFEGIRKQLTKKFGHLGERVVEDNLRVIRRGFDEVQEVDYAQLDEQSGAATHLPVMPERMEGGCQDGIGNPGRFWDQVCTMYKTGQDVLADPFTAVSAMPAATASTRDMTGVRFTIPKFIPENCTGCSNCWTQCPDSAIPGVVNTVEEVLEAAITTAEPERQPFARFRQLVKNLGKESRKLLRSEDFVTYSSVFEKAYENIAAKMKWDADRRTEMDLEYDQVHAALVDFPLAKTVPFFDVPEGKAKDSGGLLSITVNPETCKGCDVCVAVCPDNALVTVVQTDDAVAELRENWSLWKNLPQTQDAFVKISNLDEGIGVLSSLLLKKENYQSMVGGDGACMGCGEKTVIHLVVAAVTALMVPRVDAQVEKLEELIQALDSKARSLLSSDADLEGLVQGSGSALGVTVDSDRAAELTPLVDAIRELKDLQWRYTEGPSGRGRAHMGFTNSTGCTSVWGSSYPYNPYPFPWVNHLFQDAPSVAVGIFEGHMRKMADGFIAVRRAQKLLDGSYDEKRDEKFFQCFNWELFDDEEFNLCPPLFAVGGDGAMMDIGFQNLSRLLASDKPIRVMVVDTQVYSNTGGQACTSGFGGQISDMAGFGAGQRGKKETRKELALIAMAHRGAFVLQSSQATPTHLLRNVIKGLAARHPAIFVLNTPCPTEWGISDDSSFDAAKQALESRAVPNMVFDPDAGRTFSECLDLDGNPAMDDTWPMYVLEYLNDDGDEAKLEVPMTIADWAAGEARFRKHFARTKEDQELAPFHEYLDMDEDEREDVTPFIHTIDRERKLGKMSVSEEIVALAEERLHFWSQLKEMAGVEISEAARETVAEGLEEELDAKLAALRVEYEGKLTALRTEYPKEIARRMAEGLLRSGSETTLGTILEKAESWGGPPLGTSTGLLFDTGAAPAPAPGTEIAVPTPSVEVVAPGAPAQEEDDDDDDMGMDPYIDTLRCTSCDECTNINDKVFAYNGEKQAYIKDAKKGTFKQMVMAAEACPAEIIHPGNPLNPKEKDLDRLIKRAEPFN